jgi:hypothetical protein
MKQKLFCLNEQLNSFSEKARDCSLELRQKRDERKHQITLYYAFTNLNYSDSSRNHFEISFDECNVVVP